MTQRDSSALSETAWISLAIVGLAILVFGLLTALMPASGGAPYLRAIGVASIGMGLFGVLITTIAYRGRERWAWGSPYGITRSSGRGTSWADCRPGKITSTRSCSSWCRLWD